MEQEIKRIVAAKKDIRNFEYLYRKYYPMINNFVYHRVPDLNVKNEIVSNIFFKAMSKLNLFRILEQKRTSFSAWLFRIAISEINQYFRDRKRAEHIQKMYFDNNLQVEETGYPLDFEMIRKKMLVLKPQEQNLIALRYFEKMSYQQMSEILKKSEGALKVQIHRTLKKLKSELVKEMKDEGSRKDFIKLENTPA